MPVHDVLETAAGLAEMEFGQLEKFNEGHVGVFWTEGGPGSSPWEMHPDDDELLHILEGEALVTLLLDDGPVESRVPAGSLFVVPRGRWHKQQMPVRTCELYVTPGRSEHSTAEDPRKET